LELEVSKTPALSKLVWSLQHHPKEKWLFHETRAVAKSTEDILKKYGNGAFVLFAGLLI
jgi:hypothetical protein